MPTLFLGLILRWCWCSGLELLGLGWLLLELTLGTDGLQDPLGAAGLDLVGGFCLVSGVQHPGRALKHLGVLSVDVRADHASLVDGGQSVLDDGSTQLGYQTSWVLLVPRGRRTWLLVLGRRTQVYYLDES